MDVNDRERIRNITLGHKLEQGNSNYIAVLHFSQTVVASSMSTTHALMTVQRPLACS